MQTSEPSSRHWRGRDVNEQLEDYYGILTRPDKDSAEEPSVQPVVTDSTAATIRMAFRKPLFSA